MIGPGQDQIDSEKIDEICQQRQQSRRQCLHDDIASKRNEIERNPIIQMEEDVESRPYGFPWDLQGAAEDAWYHILKWVQEPSSIKTLWQVSETFRRLLNENGKYVESTLPEIIKLIGSIRPKYLLREKFEDDIENYRVEDADYYEWNERERNFFALRRVSKLCKKSIECHRTFELEIEIKKLHEITDYMKKDTFNATEFLPVDLQINEDGILGNHVGEEFNELIPVFLGKVGGKIRSFDYTTYHHSAGEVYNHLGKWVGLMPNLERIFVFWGRGGKVVNGSENTEEIEPFPHCPSLKQYSEHSRALPAPYVQKILEASPNITNVHLNRECVIRVLGPLVKLSTPQILSSNHFGWKINKLHLEYPRWLACLPEELKPSCRDLFKCFEHFGNTLEHLEVMMDVVHCEGEYLRLPNLKILWWNQHPSFQNIDFLLCAEKLETLQVKVAKGCMNGSPLAMKYKKIVGDESGSFLGKSVWEVFPYLERIRVVTDHYYEHFRGECFEQCRVEEL